MTEKQLRVIEDNYEQARLARRRAREASAADDLCLAFQEEEVARTLTELLAEIVPPLIAALRQARGVKEPPAPIEFEDWRKRKDWS